MLCQKLAKIPTAIFLQGLIQKIESGSPVCVISHINCLFFTGLKRDGMGEIRKMIKSELIGEKDNQILSLLPLLKHWLLV